MMIKGWWIGKNDSCSLLFYIIVVDEALYDIVRYGTFFDGGVYFIVIIYVLTMALKANWWIYECVVMMTILCVTCA